jgi:PDZ domain-containing secreted protein
VKNRRFWIPATVLLAGLGLLLVACSPVGTTTDSPLLPSGDNQLTIPGEAQEIVSHVRQDLAEQLNVSADRVQVVAIEAEEWADTSLGCPREDVMYAQVITPGYRVTLDVEGTAYTYHTGPDHFVRCEATGSEEQPAHSIRNDSAATTLGALVQQDLSQLLGISLDDVTVVSAEAVQWPDTSLGCPEEGMMYLQMVTPGYRIVVAGEGQQYEYHTDMERAVLCEK